MYEVEKSDSVGDETLEAITEICQGHRNMATVFEVRDNQDKREQLVKRLEVFTDPDWASDHTTRKSTSCEARKSTSCAVIMEGGIVTTGGVDVCRFGTSRD